MTVKRAVVLSALLLQVSAAPVLAADLRITDSSGATVVVIGASIDYGGFLAADVITDGIRVMQGDGMVMVKWADVESLTVTGRDDTVKPARVKLEIVLKSGTKVPASLARQGRMKLSGKTELGEYSIDLDKIRAITPVRRTGAD
jgi:hypothetical protein